MHAKMYLFSKTGAQPRVVMSSSANMTGAAASQYNDMFTVLAASRPTRAPSGSSTRRLGTDPPGLALHGRKHPGLVPASRRAA